MTNAAKTLSRRTRPDFPRRSTVGGAAGVEAALTTNNDAGYGPTRATGFTRIRAYHAGAGEESRQPMAHAVVVQALDYFDQIGVVGESTMTVRLAAVGNDTTFNGLASLSFATGAPASLRWDPEETTTSIVLRPDATAYLVATLHADEISSDQAFSARSEQIFSSKFPVRLRACRPGEELADDGASCVSCPIGEYWDGPDPNGTWTPDGWCSSCPHGMACDEPGLPLTSVTMRPGFWRAADASRTVYACPSEHKQCPGGGNGTSGNALCADGSKSVRCMKCEKGWYGRYDLHTRWRCNRCKPRNANTAKTLYALTCAAFFASLVWLAFSRSGQTFFILVADTQGGAADDIVAAINDEEEVESNDSRNADSEPDVDRPERKENFSRDHFCSVRMLAPRSLSGELNARTNVAGRHGARGRRALGAQRVPRQGQGVNFVLSTDRGGAVRV